jgi:hypothetical protein
MSDPAGAGHGTTLPGASAAPRKPVSIERSVDEGVLIAQSAVTMDVKNRIIVGAIRDGSPFDVTEVRDNVKRELRRLGIENEDNAKRLQSLAVEVQTPRGAPDNSEGYQTDDHPTLTKRGIIHLLLAEELERLSEDHEFVAELAERARVQAWAEVGSAIETRLIESLPKPPDEFYEADKDARIRAFYNINLRALEKQAKRAARRAPPTHVD